MSRAHLENVVGAALMAADDWGGAPLTFMLDALIWVTGGLVLYLYGVRGTGGGRW